MEFASPQCEGTTTDERSLKIEGARWKVRDNNVWRGRRWISVKAEWNAMSRLLLKRMGQFNEGRRLLGDQERATVLGKSPHLHLWCARRGGEPDPLLKVVTFSLKGETEQIVEAKGQIPQEVVAVKGKLMGDSAKK